MDPRDEKSRILFLIGIGLGLITDTYITVEVYAIAFA